MGKSRLEEHRAFFKWFIGEMADRQPDALVISGDIFDHGLPPHEVQQLYYESLIELVKSGCRHVIVTGGNHDSVSFLEASKKMFETLGVRVFAHLESDLSKHICPILSKSNEVLGHVLAIPYLRERELRSSVSGESAEHQRKSLLQGMCEIYQTTPLDAHLPKVAMGHFFCQGSSLGDTERELYLGELEAVPLSVFGENWDYVALGHLHRAQAMGADKKIWYSGTPIPMSFKEASRKQYFLEVEFDHQNKIHVEKVEIPRFRPILSLSLHPDDLKKNLKSLKGEAELSTWLELTLSEVRPWEWITELLQETLDQKNIEVLSIRYESQLQSEHEASEPFESLDMLDPEQLFQTYLQECEVDEKDHEHLKEKFKKVCSELQDKGAQL